MSIAACSTASCFVCIYSGIPSFFDGNGYPSITRLPEGKKIMKIMGIRKVIHKYVKEKISYQSDRTGTDM
jgi:hypothetical protein